MKNIRNIALILLLMLFAQFCIVQMATAQENQDPEKIFSFVPQTMILHGIRVDWERKINENKWIQLCPEVYFANGDYSNGNDEFNELVGAGLRLYKKRYVNNSIFVNNSSNVNELGIYLAAGPTYQYYHLNYLEDNNTEAYTYKVDINKLGFDILIGYQFLIKDIVSIDIYTGLGARYSFVDPKGGDRDNLFDGYYTSYGFTGNLIHGGLRIGLKL